ncbi:MAG: TetR/AcrR family transcriptional regulator [Acidobacteriota bacterium]
MLLDSATRHFAEEGFYGASISGIAGDVGITKQALIHHFGTKEKLYGEVLQQLSDRLLSQITLMNVGSEGPEAALESLLLMLYEDSVARGAETRLVVRELLDNKRRAEQASSWYLKPVLDAMIDLTRRLPGWREAGNADALALVYQLLGAIYFFAISEPTLTQMFGKREHRRLKAAYPSQLRTLIRVSLANSPATT